jgi:hypothetical protein
MEGIITAIHGDVIEVEFDKGLPNIHDALVVKKTDGTDIVLEVHDHISNTAIKCIALGFTQGLKRGMEVISHRFLKTRYGLSWNGFCRPILTIILMVGAGYMGGYSFQVIQKDLSRVEHIVILVLVILLSLYVVFRYVKGRGGRIV